MIDMTKPAQASTAIAHLNDLLRSTGIGGRTVLTRGVSALPTDSLTAALRAVSAFDAFTPDNDPYGEHDCASIEVGGYAIIWKIDYYDPAVEGHSSDPADPAITTRILTIMLGEEY
jgi:hypothetical protein